MTHRTGFSQFPATSKESVFHVPSHFSHSVVACRASLSLTLSPFQPIPSSPQPVTVTTRKWMVPSLTAPASSLPHLDRVSWSQSPPWMNPRWPHLSRVMLIAKAAPWADATALHTPRSGVEQERTPCA